MFEHDTLASLAALSVVLDMANGFAEDKSLLAASLATDVADFIGAPAAECAATFFSSLLRHLGCTSFAYREAELVADDIALRRALATADSTRSGEVMRAVHIGNHGNALDTALTLGRLAFGASAQRAAWTGEACGGAHSLALAMGFGPSVRRALDEVFERHDGRGSPEGLRGDGISRAARVAAIAHTIVSHAIEKGCDLSDPLLARVLKANAGLDPVLVEATLERVGAFSKRTTDGLSTEMKRLEPLLRLHAPEASVETIASAFGEFADLQSTSTHGHARNVANLAVSAAALLGLSAQDSRLVQLGGYLHDIGQVAVPTRLWEKRGVFAGTERTRAQQHVYYTEHVLSLAAPLESVARIAGAHHERLDGSGYHRGTSTQTLPMTARLLAAADVACALREARPHRKALGRVEAREELERMATAGLLDVRCVQAVLGTSAAVRVESSPVASLTAREKEVLRWIAYGRTNKEIGSALGISSRTVQTHTVNVYEKLGVHTRAAATLLAARSGLFDLE